MLVAMPVAVKDRLTVMRLEDDNARSATASADILRAIIDGNVGEISRDGRPARRRMTVFDAAVVNFRALARAVLLRPASACASQMRECVGDAQT